MYTSSSYVYIVTSSLYVHIVIHIHNHDIYTSQYVYIIVICIYTVTSSLYVYIEICIHHRYIYTL